MGIDMGFRVRFCRGGFGLGLMLITLMVGGPVQAELPKIGVPAAVRPDAHGTPPGLETHILQIGVDLHANEAIVTGPTGQTHLLFLDGSTISIGPNSELRLDKFVYDTETKKGELVASVSKGVFRFVGGRISKTRPVLFKAPNATIGIRGGVAIMEVNSPEQIARAQAQGRTLPPVTATMLFGDAVTMQTPTQLQRITKPGFQMSATGRGGVTPPKKTSQAELVKVLSTLEDPPPPPPPGDGEQTAQQLGEIAPAAGGPTVSNEDVAASQMAALGSQNDPAAVGGGTPGAPPPPGPGATNDGTGGGGELTAEISQTSQQTPVPPIGTLVATPNGDGLLIETAADGTLVGVVSQASDDAVVPEVVYSLTENADGRFAIDPTTGEITVLDGGLLDFETEISHEISVLATSTDGTTLAGSFLISLFDDTTEFQVTPIVDSNPSTNGTVENAPQGTMVGVMTVARDDDATDSVSFTLLDNAEGRFSVDPVTGVVSVADSGLLDFENSETYSITVLATSTDGTTSEASFTIALTDDNREFDVTPVSDSDAAINLISESAPNTTPVMITGAASDGDGSDTITYSLSLNPGNAFSIDPNTGVVTVNDASVLDFESGTSLTIEITAASTDGTEQAESFIVTLSDDNTEFDVTPVSDSDAAINLIPESAPNTTPVMITGAASDGDGSDTITYSLTVNPGGVFAIDPVTGVVTVADASLLDFETDASLTIEITATSSDDTQAAESFIVTLSDANEFSIGPVSDTEVGLNVVDDRSPDGTLSGVTALATDLDGTDNTTYSLIDDSNGRYSIDPTTGVITVLARIIHGDAHVWMSRGSSAGLTGNF